jgi:hypothetical protein
VERVACPARGLVVQGRLYGTEAGRCAVVEARRAEPDGGSLRAAVRPLPGDGSAFACELTGEAFTGPGLWQLWLRNSRAAEPVRLARLLDDLPDKRRLVPCPPLVCGGLVVSACFTSANDLALRVERTAATPRA